MESTKVAVYIHGLHGSSEEAGFYSFLSGFDVIGIPYQDGNPWEVGPAVASKVLKAIAPYEEAVVIAPSIGAFYAYHYLRSPKIKRAFFLSPLASMHSAIFSKMMDAGIYSDDLKEKKFVKLKDGTLLSYDFYMEVSNPDLDWTVPTEILYGMNDTVVCQEDVVEFAADHNAAVTYLRGAEHWIHKDEEMAFVKEWILRRLRF